MAKGRGATLEVDAQLELENMPPASPMGRAARAILAVRDERQEVEESFEKREEAAKSKLLDLMNEEEKDVIVVDGRPFRKVHRDAHDEIRILPAKKAKKRKVSEDED